MISEHKAQKCIINGNIEKMGWGGGGSKPGWLDFSV